MCIDFKRFLNVRRIDCRPTRDFSRSVGVRIASVPTSHASKLRLAFTVSFIDLSTLAACAGCVARINEPNRDAGAFCLVEYKLFQLVKRPAVQTAALLFVSPYPNSDVLEVFKSDSAFGALSSTNYLLGNYVVHVRCEPLLLATATAHKALCGLCTFLLELAAQTDIACTFVVHGRTAESCSVRGLGDRHKPKIHAYPIENLFLIHVGNIDGCKKEPFLVAVNQIGFATLESQKLSMVGSANELDLLPSVQRPHAGEVLVQVPREDAGVIADRAMLSELTLSFMVKLVSVGNLGVQTHDDLSRQLKLASDLPIEPFVQRILTKLLRFPREFAQAIARNINRLKRAQQSVRLLGRRLQFDWSSQFDASLNTSRLETTQLRKNGIPLSPKGDSLLPKNL